MSMGRPVNDGHGTVRDSPGLLNKLLLRTRKISRRRANPLNLTRASTK